MRELPPDIYMARTALKIRICTNVGTSTPVATGFIAKYNGRAFLVSNKHVFSGRNADTAEWLGDDERLVSESGEPVDFPAKVRGETAFVSHLEVRFGLRAGGHRWRTVELWGEDKRQLWHSPNVEHIDLAAIEIEIAADEVFADALRHQKPIYDPVQQLGGRLFLAGFLHGQDGNGVAAPVLTATVATELGENVQYRGLGTANQTVDYECSYIDVRARQGCSGSPVFEARNPGELFRMEDGNWSNLAEPSLPYLVGIYSGRVKSGGDLARLWHRKTLIELLDSVP